MSSSPKPIQPTKRACDACRRRKVKCDASAPVCANCRTADFECLYNDPPLKRGPKGRHRRAQIARRPELTTQSGDVSSSPSRQASGNEPAQQLRDHLVALLLTALPDVSFVEIANTCVSIFLQYYFPNVPIVHEEGLRSSVSHFSPTSPSDGFHGVDEPSRVESMRSFTLLTAVCAFMAYISREPILPYRHLIAEPFLTTSRKMLRLYEDFDLEYPNSSSITIRLFHSLAIQHATGRPGLSWSIFGQARLIAQSLHLYNEATVSRKSPVEAQLCRFNFWLLYTSDRAASALDNRATTLYEAMLDSSLTLDAYGDTEVHLLDTSNPNHQPPFEIRLLTGFQIHRRLSALGSDITSALKSSERDITPNINHGNESLEVLISRMTQMYLDFMSMLDNLPNWLLAPDTIDVMDEAVANYQKTAFGIQKLAILSSFHCLRSQILCQCVEHRMTAIMGLSDQPLAVAMRKTEIAHDFIQVLGSAPFLYLQVCGEPIIEKIRHAGTILLELIQNTDNDTIRARSESLFSTLLDILTRLDSRASDELINPLVTA